ncbi:spermidine synthase [Thermodesulfobacteriota bacterium]
MKLQRRMIIGSIIATGISSITVQLVTIREFLSQFEGNEITISLVLFCWLLFTGLGSQAAKLFKTASLTLYTAIILFIALWPLAQLVFIRAFREAIFTHGVSPGFYEIFFFIGATTSLYCLLVGFILPYALTTVRIDGYSFTSGALYITDSIGDITGGVLFSFILVYFMTPFKAIAASSGLLILTGLALLYFSRKYLLLLIVILLTALFCFFSLSGHYEKETLSPQYGDILRYMESPYGRVVITKEGPQHTFWESGLPLYSDAHIIKSEEKIHYPLSQLDRVESVLLVSGGLGEALDEVSKYQPKHIDYVELDPYLTGAARELGFIRDIPGLEVKNIDGRNHIKRTEKKYDAIVIDLPDPDTFQINRFFTREFFAMAKNALTEGGVLSFSMAYSANYVSKVTRQKFSTVYNTAHLYFENILILPGGEAYFLCSDGRLWTDIPTRLKMKGISTQYVEGFYEGNVTGERIERIQNSLDKTEYINTDFEPRLINIVFKEWFLKYGATPNFFLFALLGFTTLYILFMKREEYILFTTGLVTMGVEMLVIFTFQVIYGYIYLKIGVIITFFLLGLLPGAVLGDHYRRSKRVSLILAETAFMGLLFIFFMWISFGRGEFREVYFYAYCFIFSFFCGFQFPAATEMIGEEKSPAAGCLAADLTGAAVGTLAIGTIVIPLWGVQTAIIFLILIKISSNIISITIKG